MGRANAACRIGQCAEAQLVYQGLAMLGHNRTAQEACKKWTELPWTQLGRTKVGKAGAACTNATLERNLVSEGVPNGKCLWFGCMNVQHSGAHGQWCMDENMGIGSQLSLIFMLRKRVAFTVYDMKSTKSRNVLCAKKEKPRGNDA
eukprot:scaffold218493_cov17-Tisochrysis_lutea.AAC.1